VSVVDITVVYESVFGNTRVIAEAIADGAREAGLDARVAVLEVAEATRDKIDGAALVVVGGPTHMRGMSKASTRQKALESMEKAAAGDPGGTKARPGAEGPGVREWLDALPAQPHGRRAAAFDTRLPFPLAGGASRPIAKGLRRHGFDVVAKPAGFVVEGAEGPLRAGERDRAKAWGAGLVRQLAGQPVR
jgi:flavodoxin-like protein